MFGLSAAPAAAPPSTPCSYRLDLVTVRMQGQVECPGIALHAKAIDSDDILSSSVAFVPPGTVHSMVFRTDNNRSAQYSLGKLTTYDLSAGAQKHPAKLEIANVAEIDDGVVIEPARIQKLLTQALEAIQNRVRESIDVYTKKREEITASHISRMATQISSQFIHEFTSLARGLVHHDLQQQKQDEDSERSTQKGRRERQWQPALDSMLSSYYEKPHGDFSHLNIYWGKDEFIWGDFGHHAFFIVSEVFHPLVPGGDPVEYVTRHEVRRPDEELFTCGYACAGRTVFEEEKECIKVISNLKSLRANQIDLLAKDIMKNYIYNVAFSNCQHFLFKLLNRMIGQLLEMHKANPHDPQILADIEMLRTSALKWQEKGFTFLGQVMMSCGNCGGEHIPVPLAVWFKQMQELAGSTFYPMPSLESIAQFMFNPAEFLELKPVEVSKDTPYVLPGSFPGLPLYVDGVMGTRKSQKQPEQTQQKTVERAKADATPPSPTESVPDTVFDSSPNRRDSIHSTSRYQRDQTAFGKLEDVPYPSPTSSGPSTAVESSASRRSSITSTLLRSQRGIESYDDLRSERGFKSYDELMDFINYGDDALRNKRRRSTARTVCTVDRSTSPDPLLSSPPKSERRDPKNMRDASQQTEELTTPPLSTERSKSSGIISALDTVLNIITGGPGAFMDTTQPKTTITVPGGFPGYQLELPLDTTTSNGVAITAHEGKRLPRNANAPSLTISTNIPALTAASPLAKMPHRDPVVAPKAASARSRRSSLECLKFARMAQVEL